MQTHPFSLTDPIGTAATLGLIALRTDETIEQDFRRIFAGPDIAIYTTRVPSDPDVTPDTLRRMETSLPKAAGLLPPAARFDVVGYGCTSGTTMIGADRVAEMVRRGVSTQHVTDPLTAAIAALSTLGMRRVAIVSPYIAAVATPVSDAFARAGFEISGAVSFGEEVEERVARIDPASICAAAQSAARSTRPDAVFLSCTNLRTLDIIGPAEEALGIPVLSSNLALAWHMHRLAGGRAEVAGPGRLFTQTSPESAR